MMGRKEVVFFAAFVSWVNQALAYDFEEEKEMDSPLISHRGESALITEFEGARILEIQKQLKDASFINSVYRSAFQELDLATKNLQITNDHIKEFLLQSQELGAQASLRLENLIQRLGGIYPHPANKAPLSPGLREVPHYFLGRLAEEDCEGLFSGVVRACEAILHENQWIFTVFIEKQLFMGKLAYNNGEVSTTLILKSENGYNQIAFQLAPEIGENWTDIERMRSAWGKLLGLKKGGWPAVFYGPSRSVPEGVELMDNNLSPMAVMYLKEPTKVEPDIAKIGIASLWEKLCKWLWGEQPIPPREIGRFLVFDETEAVSGKVVFDDALNKTLTIQTPKGSLIKVHPSFDYQKNWELPLILWNQFYPRSITTLNFQHSEFDKLLNENIKKFDAKPLCQGLEEIILEYLASEKKGVDEKEAIEALAVFSNDLDHHLQVLNKRKEDLVSLIHKNETNIKKIYLEGKVLLSKM